MQSRKPRVARPPDRLASNRVNRGGIQKRSSTPVKVDKDGDLDMGAADSNNKIMRTSRGGRGAAIRGSSQTSRAAQSGQSDSRTKARSTRSALDTAAVQKAVFNELGLKDAGQGARSSRPPGNAHRHRDSLEKVSVWGLKQSKAASNEDGGLRDLVAFLERKATRGAEEPLRIKKSHLEGDVLNVFVRKVDVPRLLTVNNYTFAGASLRVEESQTEPSATNEVQGAESQSTIEILKGVLGRRYHAEAKLLDLSRLGSDPELVKMGMFNSTARESKFFPALMKVCDGLFDSAKEKEDAVVSVSLADNALPNITAVSTLSQTFPAVRNLDLSDNQLLDLKNIEGWRWKFRQLDQLLLLNNPIISNESNLTQELLKWYPTLTKLDNVEVRSQDAIKTIKSSQLALPTLPPSFRDEGTVATEFLRQFFPLFDADRSALVKAFYDSQSAFSYSVNTIAPRQKEEISNEKTARWDQQIKRSRNLAKITSIPARRERLHIGQERIFGCFKELPASKHPDLSSESSKWCIECNALPGLPDITGQNLTGVGGLLIVVHAEYVEDNAGRTPNTIRSFDRSFVLGAGAGVGGVRVVCDSLVLRAYGGSDAWKQDYADQSSNKKNAPAEVHAHLQIPVPAGFATLGPGKTDEQIQKETLALKLSHETGMTVEYSALCLEPSGWDLESARAAFKQAKGELPAEAFVH